jgi:hypothetical protein
MAEQLTRTGSIREGLEYQDLYGVAVLIEWLEHPERYEWVAFEEDEFEFLDDVVRCTPELKLTLSQIKHSGVEGTSRIEISLEELLDRPKGSKGPKDSLLQKWFKSWVGAMQQQRFSDVLAELLTNRTASDGLLSFTKKDSGTGLLTLDAKKLKSDAPEEWTALLEQTTEKISLVESFLEKLVFRFDYQEIEAQRTALSIRAKALGISSSGFRDLEEAARKWAKRRPADGFIKLSDVRAAAGWNVPRPLNEVFSLPKDFVQVEPELVSELIDKFRNVTGGAILIHGSPGSGKSTFLSSLYQRTLEAGIHCIRHHYFIQRDDPERLVRLDFEAASESILNALITEVADSLPNLNPEPVQFGTILRDVARSLVQKEKTLVLIVDGLDEVERSASAIELQRFLRDLLPVRAGLWLVFGTRPLDEQKVSFLLSDNISEQNRIRVPPFDRAACGQLLEANTNWLTLHEHEKEEFVWAFFEATRGHPLHCRYVLEALKQEEQTGYFRPIDIERVPPFGSDLQDFYSRLWVSTDEATKEIALLLALASFPVSSTEIVGILESPSVPGPQLLRALETLRPFVNDDSQNIELFHTSFGEFIRRSKEYETLKDSLLRKLVSWLQGKGPENLRWAHLNRILYFQGNAEPLLQTVNRDWLIQAVFDARPSSQIVDQLDWATHAAMEKVAFDRALYYGQLSLYLQDSWSSNEDVWDSIDVLVRRLKNKTSVDRASLLTEIQARSPDFLLELGTDLAATGDKDSLWEIISELNSRFDRKRKSMLGRAENEYDKNAHSLIVMAAKARVRHERVLAFVATVKDDAKRVELLNRYIDSLIEGSQVTILKRILGESEWKDVHPSVVDRIYKAALFSARTPVVNVELTSTGVWRRLYAVLVENTPGIVPALPLLGDLPVTAKEYDTSEEFRITHQFLSIYYESMLAGALQQNSMFDKWRDSLDEDTWAHRAYAAVGQVGFDHGSLLASADSGPSAGFFALLTDVPPFLFPEHREWWGISKAYRNALIEICVVFASLRLGRKTQQIDAAFIEELRSLAELRDSYGIVEILLKVKPAVLGDAAIAVFLERDTKEWANRIETFPERAQHYVELAKIAFRTAQYDACKTSLRMAISNALGYGYHKDMSLYLDVEAIAQCQPAGSTKGRGWLSRIAPIAKQAGNFTDGDETGNVVLQVADACESACQDVLHSMYVGMCSEEDVYWAEQMFAKVLRVADLSDPFEAALAATSIDEESRSVLEGRVKNGDKDAETVWNLIKVPSSPIPLVGFNPVSSETPPEDSKSDEQPEINPEQVGEYLNKLDPPYEQHKFSRTWFAKQVQDGNVEAAYKALRNWMRERDYYIVDHELLLEMVPFAEEFDGQEEGFQCLCMAATQSYAWSRFAYSPKQRERIWSELQNRYPDRWIDYVHRTCKTSMYGTPLRKMTFIPASPGVDFLVRFGQLEQAESLVEADLTFIEELMANLAIPEINWFDSSDNALDSLIARAFWIGPVVRERASGQLAELLCKSQTEELTLTALLKGLTSERLESRTVIWLLPMVRASRKGWNAPTEKIKQAIQTPSEISETLLSEF